MAGTTIDISAEAILLVFALYAALIGAALIYLRAVLTVISNLPSDKVHAPWSIALTVVGTLVAAGGLVWVNRPVEPELVTALENVLSESVIDASMFDSRGADGFNFERAGLCPFAKARIDQADWRVEILATPLDPNGLAINELLEHEAERLGASGWSVHRLVPNLGFAWESNFDGPMVFATNEAYVVSLQSSLDSYGYKLSRRSCDADVLSGLVEDKWREVDEFFTPPDSVEDALAEAEALVTYLPGAEAAVMRSEHALAFGTNQLCAGSLVETGSLSIEGRQNTIAQMELRMEVDGWNTEIYERGKRLQLVAERGERVVVAYFSTTVSSLDMVVVRGYPRTCTDPEFISAGFERA